MILGGVNLTEGSLELHDHVFKTLGGGIFSGVFGVILEHQSDGSHLCERVVVEGVSQEFDQIESVLSVSEVINEIQSGLTTLVLVIGNLLVIIIDSLGDPIDVIELVVVFLDHIVGIVSLAVAFSLFGKFLDFQISNNCFEVSGFNFDSIVQIGNL